MERIRCCPRQSRRVHGEILDAEGLEQEAEELAVGHEAAGRDLQKRRRERGIREIALGLGALASL